MGPWIRRPARGSLVATAPANPGDVPLASRA